MITERAQLRERFEQMEDDELLRRYRSGDMTILASDVAVEVLRKRNLSTDMPPATESEIVAVPAGLEEFGDLVCLTRVASPVRAELLCGLLSSEGVNAISVDSNLVRMNPMLTQALGGIRIMVGESELELAREIEAGFRRGDFALSADD